ncbi:helix-turn-helix domain-containing protein [Pseudomonas sp. NPDC088368]|uniref:helix-turn-helix domain-containing protein n=1 Tax=Pseudomonas sp. NPDC088368 TaxID=3364453 RepID=UPI0038188F3B
MSNRTELQPTKNISVFCKGVMMSLNDIEETLSRRFRIQTPPTVVVPAANSPIVFTHLRSDEVLKGHTLAVPGEDAYAFQVPVTGRFFGHLWTGSRHTQLRPAQGGSVYLFDFNDSPAVALDRPFDTLRMYISQKTLEELAQENEIEGTAGLRAGRYGEVDQVLYGIAQSLRASLATGTAPSMFYHYMALAFYEHVRVHYGDSQSSRGLIRGGLAPWQFHRVQEYIDSYYAQDVPLDTLAKLVGLSANHFARAFKQTTGTTPHRWLISLRLQKVREFLLLGDAPLAQIAILCGFVDQSHLSRVFIKSEGCTPGAWRRMHKR